MTANFAQKLQTYIENLTSARKSQISERQVSHLFLGFISDAFGVNYEDVELEHHVTMTKVQKHGYVDALLGDLIIEFKRDIKTDLGANIDQLTNYMRDMPELHRYVGMLTDGIEFRTYVLDDAEEAKEVDQFLITSAEADVAYLWFDSYLFSRQNIEPTADDIVQRFGVKSPTFQLVQQTLTRLLSEIDDKTELDVWRGQWKSLLSKVYGSDIADDSLFIRHTYLSQFAKLLLFAALEGRPDNTLLPSIVNGEAFQKHGVSNIGENDFFSWLMMSPIRADSMSLLYALSAELQVYDLGAIRQDLLKQLYQDLVDPETRHDLGEYYTPDWLAQLMLREIDYDAPQSLLDPACGSGTFLFNAIRQLADQGLTGRELVDFALTNIVGIDVHPLAATIARINYLLALSEHLETNNSAGDVPPLPVFLADALIGPLTNRGPAAVPIAVDVEKDEAFHIPLESAVDEDKLTRTIDYMDDLAKLASPENTADMVKIFGRWVQDIYSGLTNPIFRNQWASNFQLLVELIRDGRDSIWAYILKNLSRPLVLAEKGFDVVIGNPPWLSYRYINSAVWQDEVKALYIYYQLIDSGDVKLFTQMDLSTLFFAHAKDRYLKDDGTLAFVMPRSVLTGAKQHRPFQRQGMTRILDVGEVSPLFNVPAAVIISSGGEIAKANILTKTYRATFDKHELPLSEAKPMLTVGETVTNFVDSEIASIFYYELFAQGASLVPRNLCFVRPPGLPNTPIVATDPELDKDAKAPWKGIKMQGTVHSPFIYGTLLSKHLLPFGWQKLNMVALPAKQNEAGKLEMLEDVLAYAVTAHHRSFLTWFEKVNDIWDERKSSTTTETLNEWFNYRNKLTAQNATDRFRVIYGGSGTNIACCVLDLDYEDLWIYRRRVQQFVVDTTCFHYTAPTEVEAHYLCAILNSPFVNNEIKAHQPEGLWGARHIQRTPFEACAIPIFEADNPDHQELARLSIAAHEKIEEMKGMEENRLLNGGPGRARGRAREILADEIHAIDKIVRYILEG
ncbi:MAG: N-6 DNA methylase [Chloroflexota bacterium]|nr:N-6 DNA methylase [Chloroflexota bacterium]MDE2946207.1 N-6 DNA methylase [Chloroflexota bacterium]